VRKWCFRCVCLLGIVVSVALGGDAFNLPLWPLDYIKPRIPVEFTFNMSGYDAELAQRMIHQSHGIEMEIVSPKGQHLQSLRSDSEGIIRTVVEVGEYRISALLATVYEGSFHAFSSHPGSGYSDGSGIPVRVIGRQNNNCILDLYPVKESTPIFLRRILTAYLTEGELNAAYVVARDLDPPVIFDLERLVELRNEMDILPHSSYNSLIAFLEETKMILADYVPPEKMKFKLPGEVVNIHSRLAALRYSRDQIVRYHVRLMDEFSNGGKLEAVLQEWFNLTRNLEIYPENPRERRNISERLAFYEQSMPEIESQLIFEIQHQYREGEETYFKGDIETARKQFTRLLSMIHNLNAYSTFSDMDEEIRAYMDDISLIFAAGQAIRDNRLDTALAMLDTVIHPNQLVHRRIKEVRRFMSMSGTPQTPGDPAGKDR
jgi:hypothetical protein